MKAIQCPACNTLNDSSLRECWNCKAKISNAPKQKSWVPFVLVVIGLMALISIPNYRRAHDNAEKTGSEIKRDAIDESISAVFHLDADGLGITSDGIVLSLLVQNKSQKTLTSARVNLEIVGKGEYGHVFQIPYWGQNLEGNFPPGETRINFPVFYTKAPFGTMDGPDNLKYCKQSTCGVNIRVDKVVFDDGTQIGED